MSRKNQNITLSLKLGALVSEYGFSTVKKVLEDWSPEALAKKKNPNISTESLNS